MVKLSTHRLDMQDARIDQAELRDFSFSKNAPAISGGVLTLDISTGNVFEVALNADITTLTITNPSPTGKACKFDLIFTADGTARAVSWPASVLWSEGGSAPSLSSTNGRKDIITFYSSDAGTSWYGKLFMSSVGAAGGSVVSASTLVRSARTGNTILGASDKSTLIDITSGTFTQTFTAAATLGSGWFCYIKNSGTGDVTLDPNASELIDGLATYVMYPGESRLVQCTGTAFVTIVQSPFYASFLSTGTFVKPPGYSLFNVRIFGGGGGGGGGRGGSAGTNRKGGTGGGGGGQNIKVLSASALSSTVTVTIAAGGGGGTGTINGNGVSGTAGGTTTFGAYLSAYGGYFGLGGTTTSENGGGGGGSESAGEASAGGFPRLHGYNTNTSTYITLTGGTGATNGTPNAIGFGGAGVYNIELTSFYGNACSSEYGGSGGGGSGNSQCYGAPSLFGATGGGSGGSGTSANTPYAGGSSGGVGYSSLITQNNNYIAVEGGAPGYGAGSGITNASPGSNGILLSNSAGSGGSGGGAVAGGSGGAGSGGLGGSGMQPGGGGAGGGSGTSVAGVGSGGNGGAGGAGACYVWGIV